MLRGRLHILALLFLAGAMRAGAAERFWAFEPPRREAPPAVRRGDWPATAIDAFVLERLESRGLAPSPGAARTDLLRRATFDLLGLPPAPEEVDAFVADGAPDAFARVADRLLASPHHGERWGRHWLDLARYAESEGFKSDETRPNAWRYRDYVIDAFNADKPYDRFICEQIAGDEFWPLDPGARLATGFNRHYPDESNARDLVHRRQEILNDITDTVGAVFTGLTVGCARCHDHKSDPITQADYYRLQAFFANVRAVDDLVLAPPGEERAHREKLAAWEEKTASVRAEIERLGEPARKAIIQERLEKYPDEIQVAVRKRPEERTPSEWLMFHKANPYLNPDANEVAATLKGETRKRWEALQKELAGFAGLHPGELPVGSVIADASAAAPATFVLAGGVFTQPRQEVQPGIFSRLDPRPAEPAPPSGLDSTGRRAALARWLTAPENPLTARVMANRLWHYHFGRGLAGTPSDLGLLGEPPTHPELLDWLALKLVDGGWSLKRLHRLLLASNTYQQASLPRQDAAAVDPDDHLLWRFPARRLEAEAIRDGSLAVAGLLNPKLGGPSTFPPLPAGVDGAGWKKPGRPAEANRRSVYIFVRRNARYPLLDVFDLPDTHESCARRNFTTTAPQALALLNNDLVLDWARAFAGRVLEEAGAQSGPEAWVRRAYRLAFSRLPDGAEAELAREFFARHRALVARRSARGEDLALPRPLPPGVEPADGAALAAFCHVLMNANEFVYRN